MVPALGAARSASTRIIDELTPRQHAPAQQRRRHVHRRQRRRRRARRAVGLGRRVPRLRQRRPARPLRHQRLRHRADPRRRLNGHVRRRRSTPRSDRTGQLVNIGEHSLNGNERDCLFRNNGDGTFTDVGLRRTTPTASRTAAASPSSTTTATAASTSCCATTSSRPSCCTTSAAPATGCELKLVGTRSNRDAVGARVTLASRRPRQTREVHAGSGYLSGSSLVQHFGLGTDRRTSTRSTCAGRRERSPRSRMSRPTSSWSSASSRLVRRRQLGASCGNFLPTHGTDGSDLARDSARWQVARGHRRRRRARRRARRSSR